MLTPTQRPVSLQTSCRRQQRRMGTGLQSTRPGPCTPQVPSRQHLCPPAAAWPQCLCAPCVQGSLSLPASGPNSTLPCPCRPHALAPMTSSLTWLADCALCATLPRSAVPCMQHCQASADPELKLRRRFPRTSQTLARQLCKGAWQRRSGYSGRAVSHEVRARLAPVRHFVVKVRAVPACVVAQRGRAATLAGLSAMARRWQLQAQALHAMVAGSGKGFESCCCQPAAVRP